MEETAVKEGVYIIEINHSKGYALINMPVYVGESYPLLPDYHDLSPLHFVPSKDNKNPKTRSEQREFLLKLINKKRK